MNTQRTELKKCKLKNKFANIIKFHFTTVLYLPVEEEKWYDPPREHRSLKFIFIVYSLLDYWHLLKKFLGS